MQVLAVNADLIVFVSRFWQTTCTAVRAGNEGFVIDSPVYPDELEALGGVLEQAGFPVSGLLATHADWDHLLGRIAFPDASLGCGESTARRLAAEPGDAQRKLRDFDDEQYIDDRPPLALGGVQSLPVPGRLGLGAGEPERELELHLADGHTADGTAFYIPWLQTLDLRRLPESGRDPVALAGWICRDVPGHARAPAGTGGARADRRARTRAATATRAGAETARRGRRLPERADRAWRRGAAPARPSDQDPATDPRGECG